MVRIAETGLAPWPTPWTASLDSGGGSTTDGDCGWGTGFVVRFAGSTIGWIEVQNSWLEMGCRPTRVAGLVEKEAQPVSAPAQGQETTNARWRFVTNVNGNGETDCVRVEAVDRQMVAAAVTCPSAWSHRSWTGPWSKAEAWPWPDRPDRRAAAGLEGGEQRHVTATAAAGEAAAHAAARRGRRAAGRAVEERRRVGDDSWRRGRGRAGCSRPCFAVVGS